MPKGRRTCQNMWLNFAVPQNISLLQTEPALFWIYFSSFHKTSAVSKKLTLLCWNCLITYICNTLEVTGLTYWLLKIKWKKNLVEDSSVKPCQDAEFQHDCMVKGVQTTAWARLMMLGSYLSLSYKASCILFRLEVRLRGLEDASWEEQGRSLLSTSSSQPWVLNQAGKSWKCHTRPLSAAEQWQLMLWTPSTVSLPFQNKHHS